MHVSWRLSWCGNAPEYTAILTGLLLVSKSSQESPWLVSTRLLHTVFRTITHLPFSHAWFSGIGGVATAVTLLRRLSYPETL